MVVILDDRDDVWEQTNPRNVLRVPAYRFWHDVWEVCRRGVWSVALRWVRAEKSSLIQVDKHFKNNYDSIPARFTLVPNA